MFVVTSTPDTTEATHIVPVVLYQPMRNPCFVFGEQRCEGQNNLMPSRVDNIGFADEVYLLNSHILLFLMELHKHGVQKRLSNSHIYHRNQPFLQL